MMYLFGIFKFIGSHGAPLLVYPFLLSLFFLFDNSPFLTVTADFLLGWKKNPFFMVATVVVPLGMNP